MKYVGLTNDPKTRKQQHGNPTGWGQRTFTSETEARKWEKNLVAKDGYTGGGGGKGWKYGYTYTITNKTKED